MESVVTITALWSRLANASNVVCHDHGTCIPVGATNSTTLPYPELKNSSDTHLVTLHNFPSSIFPTSLVYQQDTIPNREYVSRP